MGVKESVKNRLEQVIWCMVGCYPVMQLIRAENQVVDGRNGV